MVRVTRFCSSGILKWLKFSGVAPRTALWPASVAVSAVFAWPRTISSTTVSRRGTHCTAPATPRRRSRGASTVTTVMGGGSTYEPEPAAPPPRPVRSDMGHLAIRTSSGWAAVYLGNRALGRTPIEHDLPEGTHRLRILPYGRADAEEHIVVTISAAATERLTLDVFAPPDP